MCAYLILLTNTIQYNIIKHNNYKHTVKGSFIPARHGTKQKIHQSQHGSQCNCQQFPSDNSAVPPDEHTARPLMEYQKASNWPPSSAR